MLVYTNYILVVNKEILVNGYASKIARLLDEKGSDLFKHAL